MIVLPENEFLVLGTNAPVGLFLLAGLHRRDKLIAALDRPLLSL